MSLKNADLLPAEVRDALFDLITYIGEGEYDEYCDTPEDERDPNHIWEAVTLVSHWAMTEVGD